MRLFIDDEGRLGPDDVTDDIKEGKRLPQWIGGHAALERGPSGFCALTDLHHQHIFNPFSVCALGPVATRLLNAMLCDSTG